MIFDDYQGTLPGFSAKNAALRALAEWIVGKDQPGLRSREVGDPWSDDIRRVVWRLGDVVNSKPMIVSNPAANYDLLYRDRTYRDFRNAHALRRQMAYFGANDGMLHAVNLGFYGSAPGGGASYALAPPDGRELPAHELGAEVWAYIPTSLLPHLRWLPDPQYSHVYYVDLKPLVTDVKIGGKWRTVLLGGLRLGGRPVATPDAASAGAEFYYSEVFCLDVSDPEKPPELLWRHGSPEAGLTTGLPAFVSSRGEWYAVIPSGPVTDQSVPSANGVPGRVVFGSVSPYDGHSRQRARLIVLDAEKGLPAVDVSKPENADYLRAAEEDSFFNNPFLPLAQRREPNWSNHVLYYGLTVSRDPSTGVDSGAVYRLQMASATDGSPLPVSQWKLKKLYDTKKPVTGQVNSTYDSWGNLWVIFGTGRLWSQEDVGPCRNVAASLASACEKNHEQYLYGIKEPLTENGLMTFQDMSKARVMDVSGAKVFKDGRVKGLSAQPGLSPGAGGTMNYPALSDLLRSLTFGGYKRRLASGKVFRPKENHAYEMITTQPKLVAVGGGVSFAAFTSFEPRAENCGENGYGYLYILDTFTGLPHPSLGAVFHAGTDSAKPSPFEEGEAGGVIPTGKGAPTEAYISVSAAGITVSATAPDMSAYSVSLAGVGGLRNGALFWKEVLNSGFILDPEAMISGL
ncbi:MAG: hypothetical protein LBR53_07940 [Deltaproteobacteria bacterium]|nr:hypothetical protein [Deltaproteobacteria bacterium]